MAGQVYIANQYKVSGNLPVLIWSEHQDWDANREQFHCVLQQRLNSVMVTTRNAWGKAGEPACQLPASWFVTANEKKK